MFYYFIEMNLKNRKKRKKREKKIIREKKKICMTFSTLIILEKYVTIWEKNTVYFGKSKQKYFSEFLFFPILSEKNLKLYIFFNLWKNIFTF